MRLNDLQTLIIILCITLGVVITRFTPFILFPEKRGVPKFVLYLGRVLPPAMMGLLVVYCFKGVNFVRSPYALPELISVAVIVVLHKLRDNVLLSIAGGTAVYMILIRLVF